MKSQEKIKKRRTQCDIQLRTLQISFSFLLKIQEKSSSSCLLQLHQKSRNKSIWEEYAVSHTALASKCNQWFPLFFYWSFMKSQKTEETWRRKKYDVKIFDCSHCDTKFGLLFCDRNLWNLKTWRHKNMVSKLFIALIVIRNSAF